MKKLIAMLVSGLLAATLVGCGPSTTSEPPKTGPGPTGTTSGTTTAKMTTGKVTKVEKGSLSVKPEGGGEEKTFTIPDGVKVPDDVKVDSQVTVTEEGGKVTKVEKK